METFKHSFSNNRNTLTKEKTSMNEETIVRLRRTKEHVRISKSPENTNSMISSAQNVDEVYKRGLDKEKQEKKSPSN